MFVAAMTKLICCIFIIILLILRINTTLGGWKKARTEDGLSLFVIPTKQSFFVFLPVIEHGFENLLSGRLMTTNKAFGEGNLTSFLFSNKTSLTNFLKFNPLAAITQMLESRAIGPSTNKRSDILLEANYLKYSSRYYFYNLAHILT